MRDGVDHRLPRRIEQRIGLPHSAAASAHRDHLNRLAMRVFHLCGDLLQTGAHRPVARGPFLVQPAAQLAFLRPGEREHLLLIVGMQLNQGERLQYAVMQMRGHVCPLLLTLFERAFLPYIANQRHQQRNQRADCRHQQRESAGDRRTERHGAIPGDRLCHEHEECGENKAFATSVSHACPLRARVLSHGRPMPAKHGTIGSIWLPENRITAFNPDGNAMSTTPIPANMAGFEAFASVRRTESLAEGESVDCSNPV